ncbi:arsinothricin resistance N-acetyltransferase ArsN1 family B [Phenylobacterium sp.]|uniref:arsinothricin resistance N-acetyltransferase ArsN1 family B n=1 Tax=Phenylobacterium sp. TaxID=1871053 RepID=UPI0030F40B2E
MAGIRVACIEDAEAIAEIYGPYVRDTVISFEEVAPTPAQMAERMGRILRTHPYLVHEEAGEVVAYAYGSPHAERAAYRWSCDVTVYARSDVHRKGVGRRLYGELLALLEAQGLHMAYGGIALPNASSVALHEAMGFRQVALYPEVGFKQGAWRDVGWWARTLASGTDRVEPILFADMPAPQFASD